MENPQPLKQQQQLLLLLLYYSCCCCRWIAVVAAGNAAAAGGDFNGHKCRSTRAGAQFPQASTASVPSVSEGPVMSKYC